VTSGSGSPRGGLIRHRDFRLLWLGDTVSQAGTAITALALPLAAVTTLHATPFEVGVLVAAEYVAFLLLGLPAGAWIDRLRRRPVLIASDLARAAVLATIPLAAALDVLTLGQLYVVAFVVGVFTVFFDVSYQSYLPALVEHGDLVEGNAKLQASQTVAQVASPGVGGALVQALTAPFALLADAISFVVSALCLRAIRTQEPPLEPVEQPRLGREIAEGLRYVFGHPILRVLAASTAAVNLFTGAQIALIIVFLVRTLDLRAGAIGVLASIGAVGGLVGAMATSRLARGLGTARVIWLSLTVGALGGLLIPLARPGLGLGLYVVGDFVFALATVVYNVTQVSFRQALCPPRLLGRMNATMRVLAWGTLPLGGLAGGALGNALGPRGALWVAMAGVCAGPVTLLASPLRRMRDLPETEEVDVAPLRAPSMSAE
jgi:MFS family permease